MNKPRKKVAGKIRDKEKTMIKLVRAVGQIIATEGYTALGVNNIAKKAEVDKKLIYRYFDNNVNKLIETYVRGRDYWMGLADKLDDLLKDVDADKGESLVKRILSSQMEYFYAEEEMQKIIIWEISEKNKIIKELSQKREDFGEEVFKLIDPFFKDTSSDIRAILALQVAGIYYMVLRAKSNGNTFCGIDINEPKGMKRILDALNMIVELTYQQTTVKPE